MALGLRGHPTGSRRNEMTRARPLSIAIGAAAVLATTVVGAVSVAPASANSSDGGNLSVKSSKRAVKYGATATASDEYTVTVSGRTPTGATKVRVLLTSSSSACPATPGGGFLLSELPAGGRSFRYSSRRYNAAMTTPGVEHWCAYATFAPASGGTVELSASVTVTLRPS